MKLVTTVRAVRNRNLSGWLALAFSSALALNSAHAVEAPPHHISAANLAVIQNDTGNTVNSVTVTANLSINDLRVRTGSNRGDYNLQVGDSGADDLAAGLVQVSISQNGRDNGELADEQKNYAAPAFDGSAAGYWAVIQDVTSDRAEYNINCAVAYFRYSDYLCGWARNSTAANGGTNNLFTGSPGLLLGTHFKGISSGRSRVDLRSLGIYSTNAVATNTGILLVNHAKNEGNFSVSSANADGTWEVFVKDNFGNANSLEQDPTSFVYIPRTNTTVVSGKFGLDATGTNAVILVYSGNAPAFSVTNFDVGRYRLTIPGGNPNTGVLMISGDGALNLSNLDNVVSYEPDGDGWIIEARDVGPFPPLLEASTNQAVASFVYIPAATPGFAVAPTNTLLTAEFGLAATFTVQLDLAPTNDVTIAVSSSNPAEGSVSPTSLTFNATNWNLPQPVTVTGQDDALTDGPVAYSVILAPAVSDDLRYNGLDPRDIQVVNVDDEQPGISVTPTNGLFTTESGGSAAFQVFLNRQPAEDVVIALASDNPAEGTVTPASLTFTAANWSTPQLVTVTGVDDFRKDGDKVYHIVTAPATSGDASYSGVNPPDVLLVNLDDDVPAILYTNPLPVQVIEGGAVTYTITLATQPDSNVVVAISTSSAGIATVSPTNVTFTSLDWNTPRIVTVTGVDDLVTNGTISFNILNSVSSTDPLYADFAGIKTLPGLRLDNETQLLLPSGDTYFGLGMPPIGIDGQGAIQDADAVNYNNGSLTVALVTNGVPVDRIEIRNTGTNAGQIGIAGSDVSYEGNVIGSVTGGLNLMPLVVNLNSNSTLAAVQQLVRSITFATLASGASTATRSVLFTLDDGVGSTAVAAKAIHVGALRLTQYQEGGDYGYGNYAGAADIALSEVGHATPYPAGRTPAPQEGLLIDWPDGGTPNESQVLLRFDDFVGTNYWQVPSNAIVVSAELLLKINNTGDGGRFFRMLIPWDATNDTWDTYGGIRADDVVARSVYESQLGVEDGSGATGTGIISVGVTPDVQAWVRGETNHGWVIIGWPLRTDGTGFSPSEVATVGERPRLRVFWLERQFTEVSFRQGVNGYTNAHDANLRQASPLLNYVADVTLFSDAPDAANNFTNTTEFLLRFDEIIGADTNQIPPGATVQSAVLELPCLATDSMGDGGRFYAMLQPWDETTVTWSTFGAAGIQTDGVQAATTPTVVAGNPGLDPDMQGTISTFDVTSDVQAWASGVRPNYGWGVLPWPNGSNGWGTRSSKFNSVVYPSEPERERPRLRVYYTALALPMAATLQPPVVTPGDVQIHFNGTANKSYTILRAAQAGGPFNSIGSAPTDGSGNASFTDLSPLPQGAFYRIVYP